MKKVFIALVAVPALIGLGALLVYNTESGQDALLKRGIGAMLGQDAPPPPDGIAGGRLRQRFTARQRSEQSAGLHRRADSGAFFPLRRGCPLAAAHRRGAVAAAGD